MLAVAETFALQQAEKPLSEALIDQVDPPVHDFRVNPDWCHSMTETRLVKR